MSKPLAPSGEILFQGITVNEFYSGFDLAAARSNDIGAIIMRASAGKDYVDYRLDSYVDLAKSAGLRLGFYHYLIADDEAEARSQAAFFCKTIEKYNYALRPSMRFETLSGLNFDSANRIAAAFLQGVESVTGIAPAVYTDAESASFLWNKSIAEKYPLWVIDDKNSDAPQAGTSPWKNWVGWQYAYLNDPMCARNKIAISRFTSGMLSAQIVLPDTPVTPAPSNRKLICISVAYGDTLSAIARLFNTTVDEIVRLNDIENPNLIFPGQRLYLWVNALVPYKCCDTYIVRRGDTLSAIARRFSLDWRRIASINEIANPDRIYPGQEIKLGICTD